MNKDTIKNTFITLLFCCSAITNVFLARQVIYLKKLITAIPSAKQVHPVIGELLPPIKAKQFDGIVTEISYQDELPTVLYIFSPACGWCLKNADYVNTMHEQTNGRYRFIGISLSSNKLAEYISKLRITYPVYAEPLPDSLKLYNLGVTPQTIVLSPKGEVLKNWIGAYSYLAMKNEIENYMKVKLPVTDVSS